MWRLFFVFYATIVIAFSMGKNSYADFSSNTEYIIYICFYVIMSSLLIIFNHLNHSIRGSLNQNTHKSKFKRFVYRHVAVVVEIFLDMIALFVIIIVAFYLKHNMFPDIDQVGLLLTLALDTTILYVFYAVLYTTCTYTTFKVAYYTSILLFSKRRALLITLLVTTTVITSLIVATMRFEKGIDNIRDNNLHSISGMIEYLMPMVRDFTSKQDPLLAIWSFIITAAIVFFGIVQGISALLDIKSELIKRLGKAPPVEE